MRSSQLIKKHFATYLARRVPVAVRVLAVSTAITAVVLACGWGPVSDSIRFSGRTQSSLARLPEVNGTVHDLREIKADWADEARQAAQRANANYYEDTDYNYQREAAEASQGEIWTRAAQAELTGDWAQMQTALTEYLARTAAPIHYTNDSQAQRNQAFDRLDALTALAQGASSPAVADYLAARRLYDDDKTQSPGTAANTDQAPEDFAALLTRAEKTSALRDNVAYLRAAQLYQSQDYPAATEAFSALARDFPNSEKRDAALFMTALAQLKQTSDFDGSSGDVGQRVPIERPNYSTTSGGGTGEGTGYGVGVSRADATPTNQVQTPATLTPPEKRRQAQSELRDKCCSEAWQTAYKSFTRLLETNPQSRYADDARGWLGYLWLRAGERGKALTEYYRLLSNDKPLATRLAAVRSLNLTRLFAESSDLTEVETALADEPQAALAYAYYDLYNFYLSRYSWADGYAYDDDLDDQAQVIEKQGLQRLTNFAGKMLKKYPNAAGAGFAVRLAGADWQLGNAAATQTHARFALNRGAAGVERARALLLDGAAARKLGNYQAAQTSLKTLIRENQNVELTQQAQQLLALTAEDAGAWGTALEAYWAIGYDADAAYLIDVLMTPAQIATFIEAQPQHPKLNLLLYSLGLRYLRLGQWNDARTAYQRIRTEGTKSSEYGYIDYSTDSYSSNSYSNSSDDYKPRRAGNPYEDWKADPKEPVYDNSGRVPPRLVQRDLQTVNDLERLERMSRELSGLSGNDDTRAEALYQYASYLYQSSTLLFYNPLLWHSGSRHYAISDLASYQSYHAAGESETLWQYEQQHETLARALPLFLEVVDRYPDSRAAPDALYTAALCHGRLADYFDYWRKAYERGQHAGYRIVTLAEVEQKYPRYRFPKGTRGWEPASRTVNGGPAWDAPPKPRPPLTRSEYIKYGTRKMASWIGGGIYHYGSSAGTWLLQTWRGTLAPWLVRLALLLATIALWRIARRTRRQIQQRRISWPKHHTTPLEFLNWWRGLDLLTRRLLAQALWLYALTLAVSWQAVFHWK